jgi:hypothetical protein
LEQTVDVGYRQKFLDVVFAVACVLVGSECDLVEAVPGCVVQ